MQLGKLEKVPLRQVWVGEATHFTPWLAKEDNIALLSEVVNLDLEVQAQEERVGPFKADILCKDTSSDHFVLIENQIELTDHRHLGQLMTYAAGLNAVTIIWIAEKFTEEHRAALDWLNRITDETVDFFGIEIELYRIGASQPAPKFSIVSKPNNWSKNIKRTADSTQVTDTKLKQQQYWQAFKEYSEANKPLYRSQKPLPQHWTNISIGRSNFLIQVYANTRDQRIAVALVVYGPEALENFSKLRELYKMESLAAISPELQWEEKEGGKEHHVVFRKEGVDPLNEKDWPTQHEWLKYNVEQFIRYFKDKIRQLS